MHKDSPHLSPPCGLVMATKKRYKATICDNLQQSKSFHGSPRTREEQLELIHQEADEMAPLLPGSPFCYNHDATDRTGVVVACSKTPDNKWDVEFEIDGSTLTGRNAQKWIETSIREVSLAHMPGNGRSAAKPVEVSYCFKGARANTVIHSVFDSNTGKYIPLESPAQTIAASADDLAGSPIPQFTIFVGSKMVEASEANPAPAAAAAGAVAPGGQSMSLSSELQAEAPAKSVQREMEDDDDEKDESVSKARRAEEEVKTDKKQDTLHDETDLDIKNINRLRESLEKSTTLSKADRIALQNTITTSAMRYSKTQEQLQALSAKLRSYEEKELAAREAKLASERAEMEREADKHRKIIGDFYNANRGNPLAEKAVQACKDKSTTNAMLEVYASSCVMASATEPARMSPAIAAEWQRHVEEREAARRNKPAAAAAASKRTLVAASASASVATPASAPTQVNASAMDVDGEDEEDDYFERSGLVLASADGRKFILGDPLEYPPEFHRDNKGIVYASAAPTTRQLSRMTDYQRRHALEDARRTFQPWTKGTGARFNMHEVPDQLKHEVVKLWCSFPGGTGFTGNGANVYRRADHCSEATIRASRDNVDPAQQALDMDGLSDWAKKVNAVDTRNNGRLLPA